LKRLEVRLTHEPGRERVVGQLAESGPRAAGGRVVFEYDPDFLRDPLWARKPPRRSGRPSRSARHGFEKGTF
jgi:hypothetical protein